MLARIHHRLASANRSYAEWHRHPLHTLVHWSAFVAVSLAVTAALVEDVRDFSDGLYQPVKLAAAQTSYIDPVQDQIYFTWANSITQSDKDALLLRQGLTVGGVAPNGMQIGIISTATDTPEEVVQRLIVLEPTYIAAAQTIPVPVTQPSSGSGGGTVVYSSGGGGGSTSSGGGGGGYVAPQATPIAAVCNPSATGIPASALALQVGSMGAGVYNLQMFLAYKGFLKQTSITSYYDQTTRTALAAYLTSVKASACLSGTSTPATTSVLTPGFGRGRLPAGFQFPTVLKWYTSSTYVKYLQIFLNDHGFTVSSSGAGSFGNESLYFGPATKAAIIRFQERYASEILVPNGLTKGTGNFGVSTMKKVNQMILQ